MKQKQSQKVIVNINQAKAKRKRKAKKSAKKKTSIQPPFYSPMPQPVIRYYDNQLPQRNITFQPTQVKAPEIIRGLAPETEYAQPIRAERKPIKVPTPLPETEHVLLREEEPVSLGGEEAPSARDVIEEQPAEPPTEPPEEKPKRKRKEKREVAPEFEPTFTQPKFAPVLEPVAPPVDELQKERKQREPEPPWYKEVKKDFRRANDEEKQYDIEQVGLTEAEAGRRYDTRRRNYIQSSGQDTGRFSYATPPTPQLEASGGGFSFV